MRLEINYKEKNAKVTNTSGLKKKKKRNKIVTGSLKKSKARIFKIPGEERKWKHNDPKYRGHNKSSSKWEV